MSTAYHGMVPSERSQTLAQRAVPVLYWSERIDGWWPDISRACPSCIGGWLDATPPDTPSTGPGTVACVHCGREVAEVQDRPPRPRRSLSTEDLAPRRGRPPRPMP